MMKSTIDEIRARFDADVERFSSLETGQSATIDAPLVLELVTQAAAATTPGATALLDLGCGAGNYSLKFLEQVPNVDVTLVDLSAPMLERAAQRVGAATSGQVVTLQGDMRELDFALEKYSVILAAATLHHLRDESEWRALFAKLFASLKPGGSIWISDLVEHSSDAVQNLMWRRYGEYLSQLKNEQYRDDVFAYIAKEDSPRPLLWQIDRLRECGFVGAEVLHKNSCFAAFGAVKP
ncbi:MAG TPA: class I SAM-dependent methyltransferase, partial [Abditibacteriaceae bacterium]